MVCPRCKFYKLKGNYQTRTDNETNICRLCDKDEQTMEEWSLLLPVVNEWPVSWRPPERYEVIEAV